MAEDITDILSNITFEALSTNIYHDYCFVLWILLLCHAVWSFVSNTVFVKTALAVVWFVDSDLRAKLCVCKEGWGMGVVGSARVYWYAAW